jgi:Holliday junction DNA helicase RuvA
MIASLKGILEAKQDGSCVVDVNGVGYEVYMPGSELDRLPGAGQAVTLYTWEVAREDGTQLYGFLSPEGRRLFKLLLGISGVGPKSALAVLSGLSQSDLALAVARRDVDALVRLPGIGRKTAERLLLELKDKFKLPAAEALPPAEVGGDLAEALEALLALGYPASQARTALQKVQDAAAGPTPGTDRAAELVRLALRQL